MEHWVRKIYEKIGDVGGWSNSKLAGTVLLIPYRIETVKKKVWT